MQQHRGQELKEMLPAPVFSIANRAEFWPPLEK